MNCLKVETMRREIIRTKRGYIKLQYIYILFNHNNLNIKIKIPRDIYLFFMQVLQDKHYIEFYLLELLYTELSNI